MLQSDIIGALFVLGFLRFGLPPEDRIQLQDLPAFNLAVFLGYLFLSFTVGAYRQPAAADPGDALAAPRHPAHRKRSRHHRAGPHPRVEDAVLSLRHQRHQLVPGLHRLHRRQLAGRQSVGAGRRRGDRARCDRDGNHRLSAVRTRAAARRGRRTSWWGAGELSRGRRHPAAGADLGAVHRRAGPGDRAGVGSEQVSDPHRVCRPADHTAPDAGHCRAGDRLGGHRARGDVDRRSAAPIALGAGRSAAG